ncbi:MAG: hypothetical protein KC731_38195, partial [Myxococcales bacterium]|nr:hypothetical protein [Myxococcales bacterium]
FLIQSEAGPQCDTWSVIRDASTLQIERRAPAPHHDTEVHRTLAPRLQSEDGRPFILRLGDYLDTEGSSLLRCQCDQDYALVWSSPDELHMLGRRIPSGTLVSYDPAEVERWYLTPAACARAAESAHERLARDPTAALELGYHLQEWALDWGATSPSRR